MSEPPASGRGVLLGVLDLLDDRVDRYQGMGWLDNARGGAAGIDGGTPPERGTAAGSVLRRGAQSEALGHCHQVRKRVGLHLAHHLTSVRLHRDLADAEFAANLFVQ